MMALRLDLGLARTEERKETSQRMRWLLGRGLLGFGGIINFVFELFALRVRILLAFSVLVSFCRRVIPDCVFLRLRYCCVSTLAGPLVTTNV